ncbi:MAG: hypothetical protein HC902_02615, partial [Calothrix sp. SM1_5_4]|nr:hypothetical protein [Calothrix sp. SM1_5_4]
MRNQRVATAVALGCAGFCTFVGMLVLFGWQTGRLGLVNLGHLSPPMSYNIALCFVLSSLGLSSLSVQQGRWIAVLAGLAMLLVAGLSVLTQVFHWTSWLNMDEVFFPRSPALPALFPLYAGAAFILTALTLITRRGFGFSGPLVCAIALAALVCRGLGILPPIEDSGLGVMGIHTSAALLALGIGLTASEYAHAPEEAVRWAPASAAVLGAALTLITHDVLILRLGCIGCVEWTARELTARW